MLASNNVGKVTEFNQLFAPLGWDIITQASLGIAECAEPFHTFIENALTKARHAAQASGLPALADDSGLVVPALGGAPGVLSARYAGAENPSVFAQNDRTLKDAANNAKLLQALQHYPADAPERAAYFVCCLVFLRHAGDPEPLIALGRWHGRVAVALPRDDLARGGFGNGFGNGFGYDPIFEIPHLGCTAAQLSAEQKNVHSHRGQALRELLSALQQRDSAASSN